MGSRLAHAVRLFFGRETPEQKLARTGVAIFRNFFDLQLVQRIERRFEANLRRLGDVFPDYLTNASQNVFSLALPFCEPSDPTLAARMAAVTQRGIIDERMSEAEKQRMRDEVGDRLVQYFSFLAPPRGVNLNRDCFARFELARPGSPYDIYALHQDAAPALTLDPCAWTAWIALSACGVDAPSLQYVDQRFSNLLVSHDDHLFIPPADVAQLDLHFTRPALNPGDLILFTSYTLHGTWVTREMTKPRYSLDIRLSPL